MKRLIIFLVLLSSIRCEANTFFFSNENDSLKNELTFSQDRLGYSSYIVKYGRKISSDLWVKSGIVISGYQDRYEPLTSINFPTKTTQWSLGFIFGVDRHSTKIMKDLTVIYGINSRIIYIREKGFTDNPTLTEELRTTIHENYLVGLGATFGLFYSLNDRFAIGSEINPNVLYHFEKRNVEMSANRTDFQFNILSNISIISIKYRW